MAQEGASQGQAGLADTSGLPQTSNEASEIFMLPRHKSRSRNRRDSRMYLVDGQLCWTASDDQAGPAGSGSLSSKRHSSVGLLFGSSMDLSAFGQSMDSSGGAGSGSDEAISYRIKWCRENIAQLKRQTWPMEKKLQVLKASKMFIKQHQGELKQSKQAKDVIVSTNAIFDRYWRHFKREFANLLVIITPWEMRIKKIESHFGSVVASYFTFLRWIFWLNLANSLVMITFVMVPELIENSPDPTGLRKGELGMQQQLDADGKPLKQLSDFNPTLGEVWEFEGFLKFSPIFYGYYSNIEKSRTGFWRNPLAFLLSAMITYLFCFFCISRKLSQNTKLSRIGTKEDEYTFCWTVFVGWDFMIGNSETAYNKTSSLVMNLKEGILEEKEQTKDRDWRLIIRRVLANVLTLMLIVASAYVVTLAVQRSENLPEDASLLQKNELQLVMSGIQFMFPPLFDVIGIIEKYHPRKALSWQLGRILFLDFLNFYTLMFSLFGTVDQMGVQLNEVSGNITLLRKNVTYYQGLFTSTSTTTTSSPSTTLLNFTESFPSSSINSSLEAFELNSTEIISNISSILVNANSSYISSTTSLPTSTNMVSTSTRSSTTDMESRESNLTGSSLLTTVLLAGSTMMPLTSETPISPYVTMPVVVDSSNTLVSSISDVSILASSTITSRELYTQSVPDVTTLFTSFPVTTSQPELKSTSSDEDYPDLGEVIKVLSSPKRRRSVDADPDDDFQEDPSLETHFDPIEREGESANDRQETSAEMSAASMVSTVNIPPIQDPYRKLGRTQWPPWYSGSADDDELEEPLEGRLVDSSIRRKTTVKPRTPKPGIARSIGGSDSRGGRVKLASSTRRPALLESTDDSTSDDEIQPTSLVPVLQVTPDVSSTLSAILLEEKSTLGESLLEVTTSLPIAEVVLKNSSDLKNKVMSKSGFGLPKTIGEERNSPETVSVTLSSEASSASSCERATVTFEHSSTAIYVNYSKLKPQEGFNASEVNYADCIDIPTFRHQEIVALNDTFRDKLKTLCWETMFGQEMVKIVVMDLVMTVVSAVSFEFMRACFVRYCNRFFFWDLERGFPGYQDFKLAENVLHLVNNQSTVWMGMFFAPGLPAINTVKLAVLMYIRSWAVLTCNIPHETVFKVSKSNNFYYWILLINLLICILPVAYAVTWIRPSWHCGPFAGECRMYIVVTKLVKQLLPPEANSAFRYLTSPGAVIPILISLILIIYYLASTVSSSKEANKELKAQLKKDKEQEAAVPEITNTTVGDATTSAPAPPSLIAGPSSTQQPAPTSLLSVAVGQPEEAQYRLAPASNLPALRQPSSQTETRPKSLLAPPTM